MLLASPEHEHSMLNVYLLCELDRCVIGKWLPRAVFQPTTHKSLHITHFLHTPLLSALEFTIPSPTTPLHP